MFGLVAAPLPATGEPMEVAIDLSAKDTYAGPGGADTPLGGLELAGLDQPVDSALAHVELRSDLRNGQKIFPVAMPFSNWAQISFPAVQDAMRKLGEWGVTVLVGDDVYKQHEPGTGDHYVHLFPWHLAWRALLDHPWLALQR